MRYRIDDKDDVDANSSVDSNSSGSSMGGAKMRYRIDDKDDVDANSSVDSNSSGSSMGGAKTKDDVDANSSGSSMRGIPDVDPYLMLMQDPVDRLLIHEKTTYGTNETVSTEIILAELYKYALIEALNTSFFIPDDIIDKIHRRILIQIKTKCKFLIGEGLISVDDLSCRLNYQVEPILKAAKNVNAQRNFAFSKWTNLTKRGLCYPGFACAVSEYVVEDGKENSSVLDDIRTWLVDFDFCRAIKGSVPEVGKVFDNVKNELKIQNLIPKLLQYNNTTSTTPNTVSMGATCYIKVNNIKSQLYIHDPSEVVMVGDIKLGFKQMFFTINKSGIHRVSKGGIEFYFPGCMPGEVECTVDANIEHTVTKNYSIDSLWAFLSVGIGSAYYNATETKKFSHSLKLRVKTSSTEFKKREPVKITISKAQADTFIERSDHYNKLMNEIGEVSGGYSDIQDLQPSATAKFQDEEGVKKLINDNKKVLDKVIKSEDVTKQQDTFSYVRIKRTKILQVKLLLDKKQAAAQQLKEKHDAAVSAGEDVSGLQKEITVSEDYISTLKTKIIKKKNSLQPAEKKLKNLDLKIRDQVKDQVEKQMKSASKQLVKSVAISATIDAVTTFICTSADKYKKYNDGQIGFKELATDVCIATGKSAVRGAVLGAGFSSLTLPSRAAQYAEANGLAHVLAKGPNVLQAGMMLRNFNGILSSWSNGEITTAERDKLVARSVASLGLNYGGIGLASLIGIGSGLIVVAGLAIAVGVSDHFLGDKLCSLLFEDDPEEQKVQFQKRVNKLKDEVLHSAYMLFNLTEHCTEKELRESYRAAVLKYHPDKGGDENIFRAVQAAYQLIDSIKFSSEDIINNIPTRPKAVKAPT